MGWARGKVLSSITPSGTAPALEPKVGLRANRGPSGSDASGDGSRVQVEPPSRPARLASTPPPPAGRRRRLGPDPARAPLPPPRSARPPASRPLGQGASAWPALSPQVPPGARSPLPFGFLPDALTRPSAHHPKRTPRRGLGPGSERESRLQLRLLTLLPREGKRQRARPTSAARTWQCPVGSWMRLGGGRASHRPLDL